MGGALRPNDVELYIRKGHFTHFLSGKEGTKVESMGSGHQGMCPLGNVIHTYLYILSLDKAILLRIIRE